LTSEDAFNDTARIIGEAMVFGIQRAAKLYEELVCARQRLHQSNQNADGIRNILNGKAAGYPGWRKRLCPHCAKGVPMSIDDRFHWDGSTDPPKCEAPFVDDYVELLERRRPQN
jgi:hypothetical protein